MSFDGTLEDNLLQVTHSLAWEGGITSVFLFNIFKVSREYFGKIPVHSIRNIYPLGLKGGVATVTLQN